MADLDRDPPIVVNHEGSKPIALPADKYVTLYVNGFLNAPILDGQAMTTYLTDRGAHNLRELDLSIGEVRIEILEELGGGGSKEVYRILIGSHEYALAFPNAVDDVGIALRKWTNAMKEPANTLKLRKAGLLVNPHSAVIGVKVGAVELPAIIMDPYDQLPFQVRDSKNRRDVKDSFLMQIEFDDGKFVTLFDKVIRSIRRLLDIGANLGSDCFNICIAEDSSIDLYFNDLGSAKFKKLQTSKRREYAEEYISYAIGAFINGLTENEYQKHKDFCDIIDNRIESNSIRVRLIEQILEN